MRKRIICLAVTIIVMASLILVSCVSGSTTTSKTATKGSISITNVDVAVTKITSTHYIYSITFEWLATEDAANHSTEIWITRNNGDSGLLSTRPVGSRLYTTKIDVHLPGVIGHTLAIEVGNTVEVRCGEWKDKYTIEDGDILRK
jgi:hypothetical protein